LLTKFAADQLIAITKSLFGRPHGRIWQGFWISCGILGRPAAEIGRIWPLATR